MILLRLTAAGGSAALGWLGAGEVTANGPDLAGIALIITAISGMIATIGGLIIAVRRKPENPNVALLNAFAEVLEQQRRDEEP